MNALLADRHRVVPSVEQPTAVCALVGALRRRRPEIGTVQRAIVARLHVSHVTGSSRKPGTLATMSTTCRASSRLSDNARARQALHKRP